MPETKFYSKYLKEVKNCIEENKTISIYTSLQKLREECDTLQKQHIAFYAVMDYLIYFMDIPMIQYISKHFFNEWSLNNETLNEYAYDNGYPSLFYTAWSLYNNNDMPFFKQKYFEILMFILNDRCGTVRRDDLIMVKEFILHREESEDQQLLLKRIEDELSVI